MTTQETRRGRRRIIVSLIAGAALVATALQLPTAAERTTLSLRAQGEVTKMAAGLPHQDLTSMPVHTHDPKMKNEISRGGEISDDALDPTTSAQAKSNAAYVASERALPDPELTTVPVLQKRRASPQNRYAMANGCYAMSTVPGIYVRRLNSRYDARKPGKNKAHPFFFKATKLGTYLLFGQNRSFLAAPKNVVRRANKPSADAEWTVRTAGTRRGVKRFTFTLPGQRKLAVRKGRLVIAKSPTTFALEQIKGCNSYPEAEVDVSGRPHAGVTPFQEVRGFVDAHTHGMAFEFLGGDVHCGKPWDKYGVKFALRDCPDHTATGGVSLVETALSNSPRHDPVGWPTFKDWPAPDSLTHEGTYYRWMERAWRGGERLFTNLLVENNQLCQIYPIKHNSCDDMDAVRLQAADMYRFQNYVDAQFGGPGKGFYRIVTDPFEAREVINAGKMAVIMGIEVSRPFGCTYKRVLGRDVPACSSKAIDRQLDEVRKFGVRQMELTNKFDNALTGVAGDQGTTGVIVNGANFLETGSFWDMKHCEPADGVSTDREQLAFPEISSQQQDALFGAIGQVFGGVLPAIPLYPRAPHCNSRDLTTLGEHTVKALAKRKMIFDPDHMSVKSRNSSLDVIDELKYPGVLSSHSWSTPDAYTRIYKEGGFITPYAGDSSGFVDKWRQHVGWADSHYYYGIGFGADINGLGAQGNPRGADVPNPVRYPFKGINGVTIKKQRAGKRVYDINKDGVAQYGLYPDWVEDLTKVADRQKGDGDAIFADMSRGPEAYLQMWERAVGVAADSCRNPRLRMPASKVERLVKRGMTTKQVMREVGQPYRRLGNEFGVCAKTSSKSKVMMTIRFGNGGRVLSVGT